MPETMRDLWPDDIAVDALSPAMILNEQAQILANKTKGLVQGELLRDQTGELVRLQFDLIIPAGGFRLRVLTVRYREDQPYPAVLTAQHLKSYRESNRPDSSWGLGGEELLRSAVAYTQTEFETLLGVVLGSPSLLAAIQSLRARANETKSPPRMRQDQLPSGPKLTAGDELTHSQSPPTSPEA